MSDLFVRSVPAIGIAALFALGALRCISVYQRYVREGDRSMRSTRLLVSAVIFAFIAAFFVIWFVLATLGMVPVK